MKSHSFFGAALVALTVLGPAYAAVAPLTQRQASGRTTPLLTDFPGQGLLPTLAQILSLNATSGSFLPLSNIQGDIFVGMKKSKELFYFFHINDPKCFKDALKTNVIPLVTSAATLLSPPSSQPLAFLNIAFSQLGLTALDITDNLGDSDFAGGQWADASSLNDDLGGWESSWKDRSIHGVFIIGSDETSYIDVLLNNITNSFGSCINEVTRVNGAARPGFQAGHEHFGYLDGISQPAITGFTTDVLPGQAVVPSGTILTCRPGDTNALQRPAWALDGSFLAFRKLQQHVPEFHKYLRDHAVQNAARTLTTEQGAELLGARMIGRWRSGAPTDLAPTADDPVLGADPQRNNNFDYSKPSGLATPISDQSRCPFDAHIRKTRPRIDQLNLNVVNVGIRAGIPYGPEVTAAENSTSTTTKERGLAFVMYQSNIGNGFRFQQINWANTATFPPGKNDSTPGFDPIIGQVSGEQRTVGGLDPNDASRDLSVPEFVKPKGGEYFFVPSISALTSKIAA